MRIPGLRGLPARQVAKEAFRDFQADDMWTYGAAVAFHGLFALFPFLLFLVAAFSFVDAPGLFEGLLAEARGFLPAEAMERVEEVVGEVRGRREGGLLSLGILAAIWIASSGVRSAMHALNTAYNVEEGRRWYRRYPLSVAYTLAFGVLVAASTLLMVTGPRATGWVLERAGAAAGLRDAFAWLRFPMALLVATAAVTVIYLAAPNLKQRIRLVIPGAVVAVLLWALVSLGFRVYVSHFGRFSVTYGSIGAVVMLLTYLYLSALVLLLGAEVNAVVQRRAPRPGDAEVREPPESGGDQEIRRARQ